VLIGLIAPALANVARPLTGVAALVLAGAAAGWSWQAGLLDFRQALAASACAGAMALWATAALPDIAATLLFFAVVSVSGAVAPSILFSGFASPRFWLVLSGMVLGSAMARTGLGARAAQAVLRPLAASYPRMVAGVVGISYALAFVIPSSMGRITLLVPVVLALADTTGLAPGRRGRAGLVLAAGFGSWVLSTSVLTANLPNLVLAGAAEALYGVRVGYLPYHLVLHAPVLGLVKGALLTLLVCAVFPDRLDGAADEARLRPARTPMTADERRLLLLLAATLALWMLDGWHGIAPAAIGLAAAAACLIPRLGVLPAEAFSGLNLRLLFLVAGLLGLVASAGQLGLGARLGHGLLDALPLRPETPGRSFALMVALSSALSLAVTADGAPAVYTALAGTISGATGLPLAVVLMAQVIGVAAPILPYQAPPLVAAQLGGVRLADAACLAAAFALLSLLLLAPLQFAWWRILGVIQPAAGPVLSEPAPSGLLGWRAGSAMILRECRWM
jgi:di/tricarboxylate transporter